MDVISTRSSLNQEFVIKSLPTQINNNEDVNFDNSSDKKSLVFYNRTKIVASIILLIGHLIFCAGFFYPIIIFTDGRYSDHSIFVPHTETLLHSVKTLYNQRAYVTLFVALVFSITLPFIKIAFTIYAVYISLKYKRSLLEIIKSGSDSGFGEAKILGRRCYWILFCLRSICKYQFVDSIIILFNVSLLKSDFIVANSGRGCICLIIYCIISIPSTQAIYQSFYEESKVLKKWVKKVINIEDEVEDKKSGYVLSELLIVFFTLIIMFSSTIVLSHEKLFFVGFSADKAKKLLIAGLEYSYRDIVAKLNRCNTFVFSFFIFMIMGVFIPFVQAFSFLSGILLYNSQLAITPIMRFIRQHELGKTLKSMLFKSGKASLIIAQILSDWACADVVALALIATRSGLITAPQIVATIPPSDTLSAFYMLMALGVGTFSIQVLVNHKLVNDIIEGRINYCTNRSISREGQHVNNLEVDDEHTDDATSSPNRHESENSYDGGVLNPANYGEDSHTDPLSPRVMNNHNSSGVKSKFDWIKLGIAARMLTNAFLGLLVTSMVIMSFKHNVEPRVFDIKEIQEYMDYSNQELFEHIHKRLPESAGICEIDNEYAPEPCANIGTIYTLDKLVYFNVPWVTGINSLELLGSSIKPIDGRIQFHLLFRFGNLSAYTIIGSYLLSNYHELYRGYDTCCGEEVGLSIKLSFLFSNEDPVISDIEIDLIHLSNVHLGGLVETLVNSLVDVRKLMDSTIMEKANKYLNPNKKFIHYQGMKLSIQDLMNYLVKINAPAGLICQRQTHAPVAQ